MNIRYLRKRLNYNLIEYQKSRMHSVVYGYPYWMTIDPSSVCNLQCRFCPTGQKRNKRKQAIMSFDNFNTIINELGPYLFHIDFCNWGEPLLNGDIWKMIKRAKTYGVTAKVDTNLNVVMTDSDISSLISSGLDRLTVSLDGATQEVYEKYRKNGNIGLVMDNMKRIISAKKAVNAAGPHIHWQYLVFRHNEHEMQKAEEMAAAAGVDSIGFTAPFCSPEWVSSIDKYNNYLKKDDKLGFKNAGGVCGWLWDGVTINADGSVSPCCSVEEEKDDFGNVFEEPFRSIWNNDEYRLARKYVRNRRKTNKENVCVRCDHIGASNHADYRIFAKQGNV
ncbi:MAG: SPASM domain-containing protein [Endomicrobiales bacterium]|nr:SPASM domain-containing protein [Endomicrobiales bacterium]